MLYTGKGDEGTTKFLDTHSGVRVSKNSSIAEALGLLDELNSFIGLCRVKSEEVEIAVHGVSLSHILLAVQHNLFIVQAEVAGDKEKKITAEKMKDMEALIHAVEKEIPPITSFTVVGGSELSALLDVARTLARKTERRLVLVCETGEREMSKETRAYANRLSSLLFAFARFVNFKKGIKEERPHYK